MSKTTTTNCRANINASRLKKQGTLGAAISKSCQKEKSSYKCRKKEYALETKYNQIQGAEKKNMRVDHKLYRMVDKGSRTHAAMSST